MLTAGDALAKTLAKSQKVTFWSQKNGFEYFFLARYCGCFYLLFKEKSFSLSPWNTSFIYVLKKKKLEDS